MWHSSDPGLSHDKNKNKIQLILFDLVCNSLLNSKHAAANAADAMTRTARLILMARSSGNCMSRLIFVLSRGISGLPVRVTYSKHDT